MKKLIYLSIALAFLACNNSTKNSENTSDSVAVETKNDEFILENLLSINSEAELIQKYGKENIKREEFYYAEGTVSQMETVVFQGNEKEVVFSWEDDSVKFNKLIDITVYNTNSVWKTKNGIKIGTRMTELEKLNEKPFSFSGFGWDYAGGVDFENGKLANNGIGITLGGLENEDNNPAYEKLLGDNMFKSNSKEAIAYNPYVVELSVYNKE